jgi:hypothetical protein
MEAEEVVEDVEAAEAAEGVRYSSAAEMLSSPDDCTPFG